jgi:hypothetical protein
LCEQWASSGMGSTTSPCMNGICTNGDHGVCFWEYFRHDNCL